MSNFLSLKAVLIAELLKDCGSNLECDKNKLIASRLLDSKALSEF
jgi:hypothetical protein